MIKRTSSQDVTLTPLTMEQGQIHKLTSRFQELNRLRLERTQAVLTARQREFLELFPLLFHINHPLLPGFVSASCAMGVPNYKPSMEAITAAKRMAKSFSYQSRGYQQFDIQAIYLMGSPGTIAFSEKSDFDAWICFREDLEPDKVVELQQKAENIMRWARKLHLDVTIFLVNPKEFRQGKTIPLSYESSGSSQHLLLLEEFYRTAIVLAGKFPLWWIVPPEQEKNYETYIEMLELKRLYNPKEYINLGSVANIPADEFLGAALWHIYKGISSPYKSILKLMLMESYASEYPNIRLLSSIFKELIYQKEQLRAEEVDPYMIMYHKLNNYLSGQNSFERTELMRQAFYFKVNYALSAKKHKANATWRRDIMGNLTEQWNWDNYYLNSLDFKDNWKLNDLIKEHKKLVNALTHSYKRLTEFFRKHNNVCRISRRDLNLLGRKLHAAFERKAGKIEVINRSYHREFVEEHISIHHFSADGMSGWKLYQGIIVASEIETLEALNQSAHLVKLLCWMFFNRAINPKTRIILFSDKGQQDRSNELNNLVEQMSLVYPQGELGESGMDSLSKAARIEKSLLLVNVCQDPFEKNRHSNQQIATNRIDAFKYGAMCQNLVLSIDMVFSTTWKEVMFRHFEGEQGLLDCLAQYIQWNLLSDTPILPQLTCSFSTERGRAIAERVEQLIIDIINVFKQSDQQDCRYVFAIGKGFYLLWLEQGKLKFRKLDSYKSLLSHLALPLQTFNHLVMDKYVGDDPILPTIFAQNKSARIQFFYLNRIKNVDIYVLDENGSLYHRQLGIEKHNVHLNHMILFVRSIFNRASFDAINDFNWDDTSDDQLGMSLEIYQMEKKQGGISLKAQNVERFKLPEQFLNIQAIGDIHISGKQYFSMYCDEQEFSAFDYGNDVYKELAKYVVNHRPSGLKYPIYITDMDLSPQMLDEQPNAMQLIQLLQHKEQIEKKLNQAIKQV